MAVDTPATIAVLGAGPIGLEAALYARFLGYTVAVYEQGRVGEHIRRWGHVPMFSPWGMNVSPLGVAAIQAQEASWQRPALDTFPTGNQYVEQYLEPLAGCDLLADGLCRHTRVVAVGRQNLLKGEEIDSDLRIHAPFRLLLEDTAGKQRIETADVVIDTTGTLSQPNWLGHGGIPAVGEPRCRDRIEPLLPDVAGAQRQKYAGRRVLVVGSGYSAATNIVALAELAPREPGTHVTWVTRHHRAEPIRRLPNDPLPQRDRLAAAANALAAQAASGSGALEFLAGRWVEAVDFDPAAEQFQVTLSGQPPRQLAVDRLIANVGFCPDRSIYRQLHVHECYASEAPMKLAASLLEQAGADCLALRTAGPESLVVPEPDFYILGAKSYGRDSRFLISLGLRQIQELFTLIGDRPNLDLYANIQGLPT